MTSPSTVGLVVPDFSAACTGAPFSLASHRGNHLVLYFYPKDNTPGCTTEGQQLKEKSLRIPLIVLERKSSTASGVVSADLLRHTLGAGRAHGG